MINVDGAIAYVGGKDATVGCESILFSIEIHREHNADNGLGADKFDQFIRCDAHKENLGGDAA